MNGTVDNTARFAGRLSEENRQGAPCGYVHVHCINHNVGDKPCNVDTKPQGIYPVSVFF